MGPAVQSGHSAASRKQPVNGFCPSPEQAWKDFSWAHLQKLEDILRFFHGSCQPILDEMTPQSRMKLLANIDIAAAEAFWAAKHPKLKNTEQKIQEILLEKTKQYLVLLALDKDEARLESLLGRAKWIVLKQEDEVAQDE